MKIEELIRWAKNNVGLKQADIAKEIGYERSILSKWKEDRFEEKTLKEAKSLLIGAVDKRIDEIILDWRKIRAEIREDIER